MKRLANYDFAAPYMPGRARLGAQVLFGVGFAVSMIGLRSLLDLVAPTSGPFALVYPTVLLATLYGRWQAGATTYLVSFAWAWYFVLPTRHSFSFELATDPARVAINAAAALVVLVFAETFRRAVRSAISERDVEIEKAMVLREELEHRTKNNFALAVSLLHQQKKGDATLTLEQSLDKAIGRLNSLAQAYDNLIETPGNESLVSMQSYLEEVVSKIAHGLFDQNVRVTLDAAPSELPRDVAVAIGLFVNEALTNCAKYAFPKVGAGTVLVRFEGDGRGWLLEVADNGIGHATAETTQSSRLGTRLMNAFATQARARYEVEVTKRG